MGKHTTVINVDPVPKPRMTRSDRWKKRPVVLRYFEFKDKLRGLVRGDLNPSFTVTFLVPMPKSWSNKKKEEMNGKPHQSKPDIDNYLKAFMDALVEDDSYIYKVSVSKFWSYTGSIMITEEDQDE